MVRGHSTSTLFLRRRMRGATLVEALTATAVLVGMAAGVGYVFSHMRDTVSAACSLAEANASVRAVNALLREDAAMLHPGGVLVAMESQNGAAPPVLMFTASGRFVSRTDVTAAGEPVSANAALIVYTLGADGDGSGVLCRYAYLLTGDGARPASLRELVDLADEDDANPLDNSDVLGATLWEFASMTAWGPNSAAMRLKTYWLEPLLDARRPLNLAPVRMDDPVGGGVRQVWPYVVGGCEMLEIAFYDGFDAVGLAAPPGAATAWIRPTDDIAMDHRRDGLHPVHLKYNGSAGSFWRGGREPPWPRALRLRLKLAGASAGEIILSMRGRVGN